MMKGPALLVLVALLLVAGAAQAALTEPAVKDDFYHPNDTGPLPAAVQAIFTSQWTTGQNGTSAGDNATGDYGRPGLASPFNAVNDSGLNFTFRSSLTFTNVSFEFPWSNFSNTSTDGVNNLNMTSNNSTAETVSENATAAVALIHHYHHNKTVNVTFAAAVGAGAYFINLTGIKMPDPLTQGSNYDAPIRICTDRDRIDNAGCVNVTLRVWGGPVVRFVTSMPAVRWYNNTTGNLPTDSTRITFNVTARDRDGTACSLGGGIYPINSSGANLTQPYATMSGVVTLCSNATKLLGGDFDFPNPASALGVIANWGDGFQTAGVNAGPADQNEINQSDGNWTVWFNASDGTSPPRWNNLTGVNIAIDRTAPTVANVNATGCGNFVNGLFEFTVSDTTGQNYSDNTSGNSWIGIRRDGVDGFVNTCFVHLSTFASLGGSDTGTAPYTAVCRNSAGEGVGTGPHTVDIQARDKTGNRSANLTASFRHETAGTAVLALVSTASNVTGTNSIASTGANPVNITFNGATVADADPQTGTWATGAQALNCGANTVAVNFDPAHGSGCPASQLTVSVDGGACVTGSYIAPATTTTVSAPPPAPTAIVETQSIITIPAFTPTTLTFVQTAVQALTIETKALAASVSVTVTQHLSRPSNVAEPPAVAAVNKYISLDAKNLFSDDIAKVTLRFTVEKKWLTKNNLSEGQVTLARHDDAKKEWQKFSAKKMKEDGNVTTFEATVPRLSVFAIIAEPAPPVAQPLPSPAATPASPSPATTAFTPPPTGTTPAPSPPPPRASPLPPAKSPGFEALAALGALAAALAFAERRRR